MIALAALLLAPVSPPGQDFEVPACPIEWGDLGTSTFDLRLRLPETRRFAAPPPQR